MATPFNQGAPTVSHLISTANCLIVGNTSSGNALSVQQLGAGNVATFRTTTGATALFVGAGGNVGIGQTNPVAPLSTVFSTSGIPDTTGSGTSNVAVRFQVGSVALDMGNIVNGNMWLQNHSISNWATNYPLLLNPNGGNVGIGTTSPGYVLDVNGTGRFNTGTSNVLIGSGQSVGQGALYILPTSSISGTSWKIGCGLQGSYSNAISFDSGCNVGIGTANPGNLLTVNNGTTDGVVCRLVGGNGSTSSAGPSIDFSISNLPTYSGASIKSLNSYTDGGGQAAHLAFYTSNWNGSSGSLQQRMTILGSGNVGIGTTSPSGPLHIVNSGSPTQLYSTNTTYNASLHWKSGMDTGGSYVIYNTAGNGQYMTYGSTAWSANSDSRLKNIIEPISNALMKVDILNPVMYSWKTDDTNAPHPGLIAQDVLKVHPECVNTNSEGMYGVQYTELIPLAFAAIKELSAKVTSLESRLAAAGL